MRGLGRRKLDCGWNSSCVKRTQFPEQESLFDSCQIRAPRRCNSYQQRSIAAVEVSKERPASPLSKKARNLKIARLASEFFAKIRNRQEQVFRIYFFIVVAFTQDWLYWGHRHVKMKPFKTTLRKAKKLENRPSCPRVINKILKTGWNCRFYIKRIFSRLGGRIGAIELLDRRSSEALSGGVRKSKVFQQTRQLRRGNQNRRSKIAWFFARQLTD